MEIFFKDIFWGKGCVHNCPDHYRIKNKRYINFIYNTDYHKPFHDYFSMPLWVENTQANYWVNIILDNHPPAQALWVQAWCKCFAVSKKNNFSFCMLQLIRQLTIGARPYCSISVDTGLQEGQKETQSKISFTKSSDLHTGQKPVYINRLNAESRYICPKFNF